MIELTIQFLSLFIPAMFAVFGSYLLYRRKQEDKREALRYSLLGELVFMEALEAWPRERDDPRLVPMQNLVPTQVYETNVDQLGLLTTREIANIARFYSTAQVVNDSIQRAHHEREMNPNADIDFSSLQSDIAALKEQRQSALDALDEALAEDNEFESGDAPDTSE